MTDFRPRPGARDWAGRSAFVLACGLALGWAGAILFAAVTVTTRPVTEQAAQFMSAIGGAIAGALATYLGSTLHHPGEPLRRRRDDLRPDDRDRLSPTLAEPDRGWPPLPKPLPPPPPPPRPPDR